MKKILLRADDLGYSRGVNYGIYDVVQAGLINNVGVMINMPFTDHGLSLLKNFDIDLGMHTNISNGKPVLAADQVPSLVDENGFFKRSKIYRQNVKDGKPDFVNLEEVVVEIEAQYQLFVKKVGRKPDYFEGHAVISQNFFKGMQIVAKRHQLAYLSISLHNEPISFKQNTKFQFVMGGFTKDGKPDKNYDPFQELDYCLKHANDEAIPMFVSHSGYLDNYLLNTSSLTLPRTKEAAMFMSEKAKREIQANNVHLVRYSECK